LYLNFFVTTRTTNYSNQKEREMPERVSEERGASLDELQTEAEKLLSLLKDRQPGLATWNMFLYERLQNLYKLTRQALYR
jgi:hypothetical protein